MKVIQTHDEIKMSRRPLSDMFRDPVVAKAFRRAERDDGESFAIPAPVRPQAPQGAEVQYEAA